MRYGWLGKVSSEAENNKIPIRMRVIGDAQSAEIRLDLAVIVNKMGLLKPAVAMNARGNMDCSVTERA